MSTRMGTGMLALAGASVVVACAHAPTALSTPTITDDAPPSAAMVARWEEAVALFARLDEGSWDGPACHAALEAFERVDEGRAGRSARSLYMSGLVALRCGNVEGARSLYEAALHAEPDLCEARVALGLLELDAGRAADARRRFEDAVRRDSRCVPGYVNLAILDSEDASGRDEALANLRRALAVRADYVPALDRMALVYLAQAEERPELLRLAEMVCRQAQLVDPTYAPIYNTWALVDIARGELTRAVAKLQRAIELDPDFFEALMNFGQITLGQRAYDDAARAFARARELRPSSYDAALGLGIANRALSHPEQAEQLYRAALELDPDRPEAYFDLAVLYHEHRDGSVEQLGQALRFLEQFVARAGTEPRLAATVADVVRWCAERREGRRRAPSCRPGRAQNIITSIALSTNTPASPPPAWLRR